MFMKHMYICPQQQQSPYHTEILLFYNFRLPTSMGFSKISVKSEQPIYELAVQLWLLYNRYHLKFDVIMDKTDRQTDNPNTRCPH